ncbi:MAG: CRISPR-associated protein Cas2 [Ilumatobacter sp.]|jgi:CRISPR-associated protein Cas2
MKRYRHLVAYDIRDQKRLRLVHRVMKGFGMPFPYSVFLCDLTSAERLDLLKQLTAIIEAGEDTIAAVDLGDPKNEHLFTFLGPRPSMPRSGPTIV